LVSPSKRRAGNEDLRSARGGCTEKKRLDVVKAQKPRKMRGVRVTGDQALAKPTETILVPRTGWAFILSFG